MKSPRFGRLAFWTALVLALSAGRAAAQQLIVKGEFGNKGGTLPPPGLYAGMIGSVSWDDELVGPDKNSVSGPELKQEVFGPLVQYVSKWQLFGANYSAAALVPFANTRIDFPRLDTGNSTGIALSQIWVSPLTLGWHIDKPLLLAAGGSDVTVAYSFYAPTGRYTAGAPDNTSLGMWTNELSARVTSYFSRDRKWHGSASLFYDFNGKKQDLDWKTGNPFTYMWGLGRDYGTPGSLLSGWVGAAGYAQWQVTATQGADAPEIARLNKSQINGIGPELTTLGGALTIRYFWEFGGKFTTRGNGLYVQLAMPLPL
jgi:hypothetical protein